MTYRQMSSRAKLVALLHQADQVLYQAATKSRDTREPGRAGKNRSETEIQTALEQHWARQKRLIRAALERGDTTLPDFADSTGQLQADLVAILTESLLRGGELFANMTTLGFDPTLINADAAAYAQRAAFDLVKAIDTQTVAALQQQISNFVTTPGYTLGNVIDNLPFSQPRSQLVATTEITRAYAEGNRLAGEKLQQQYPDVQVIEIWYTNNDSLTCPICGPLNGKSVKLNEKFKVRVGSQTLELDRPPAHPGCRCWTTTTTNIEARR